MVDFFDVLWISTINIVSNCVQRLNFVKNFISNLLFEIIPRKNFIYYLNIIYPLCRIINCYSLEIISLLESFIFYKKIFSKDRSLIRSLLQQSSSSLLIKKSERGEGSLPRRKSSPTDNPYWQQESCHPLANRPAICKIEMNIALQLAQNPILHRGARMKYNNSNCNNN